MPRRLLLPFLALVMVLPALLCTEAAEVWCRVAVGATVDVDDDPVSHHSRPSLHGVSNASGSFSEGSVVDEPTFCLPQFALVVLPIRSGPVIVPAQIVSLASDTRGPRHGWHASHGPRPEARRFPDFPTASHAAAALSGPTQTGPALLQHDQKVRTQ